MTLRIQSSYTIKLLKISLLLVSFFGAFSSRSATVTDVLEKGDARFEDGTAYQNFSISGISGAKYAGRASTSSDIWQFNKGISQSLTGMYVKTPPNGMTLKSVAFIFANTPTNGLKYMVSTSALGAVPMNGTIVVSETQTFNYSQAAGYVAFGFCGGGSTAQLNRIEVTWDDGVAAPGAIAASPAAGAVEAGTLVTFTSQGATSMTAMDGAGLPTVLTSAGNGSWTYMVNADVTLFLTATNEEGVTGPAGFVYTIADGQPRTIYYDLVNSESQLLPGKKYILATAPTVTSCLSQAAATTAVTDNNNQKRLSATDAEIANSRIKVSDDMMIFRLESDGDTNWKLATTNMLSEDGTQSGTQGYLRARTTRNLSVTDNGESVSITIEPDKNAVITFGLPSGNTGRILYNWNNGNPRFLNYPLTEEVTDDKRLPQLYAEPGVVPPKAALYDRAIFYASGYDRDWGAFDGTPYNELPVRFEKTDPQYTEVANYDAANPWGYAGTGEPEADETLNGQTFRNEASGISISFGKDDSEGQSAAVFHVDGPGVRFYSGNYLTVTAPEDKYIESIEYNCEGNFDGFPASDTEPFHPWLNSHAQGSDADNALLNSGTAVYKRLLADKAASLTLVKSADASTNDVNHFNTLAVSVGALGQISNAPLTVDEAVAHQGREGYVWVQGRIIGSVPEIANRASATYSRSSSNTTANILLGQRDPADNGILNLREPSKLLAVECTPALAPINVVTDMYESCTVLGREVRIHGRLSPYADGPGMVDADRFIIYLTGGTTSIDDIGRGFRGDNSTEFYNLQGQRIINPMPGTLVIRRQGAKATKVII